MTKSFDVIGVGCCAVDYLGIVPYYPELDVKMPMSEFTKQGGGLVATALVALSRLGAKVSYVGKVGDDELSDFVVHEFEREGVDTSHLLREKGGTARFAFIIVDEKSGKRTIFYTSKDISELRPEDISQEWITDCQILHLDTVEINTTLPAARLAKERGVTIACDAESVVPGADELMNLTDVLIASEKFAVEFTSGSDYIESARYLFETQEEASGSGKIVVVTAGDRGSYCVSAGGEFHQPAFKVEVKDTTGCGDVFHGAFIYGLLQNWDLKRTAEFASAVAALKCRKLGGRAGIPSLGEVEKFLDSQRS